MNESNTHIQAPNREPLFDIMKALGIISVVIGHVIPYPSVIRFVYSYHLALFFFVTGLQYHLDKYEKDPFSIVPSRLKSMWPSFFLYLTFFTLTNNLFVQLHLINNGTLYSKSDCLLHIYNNFTFLGGERLGGALWFVPVILLGTLIFTLLQYLCSVFLPKYKWQAILLGSLLIGAIALQLISKGFYLMLFGQTTFLLLPLITLGCLLAQKKIPYDKFFRGYIAVPCLAAIIYLVIIKQQYIELSDNMAAPPLTFYPISLCGIYLIGYLSTLIKKNNLLCRMFSFVGKYSFDIMALHFMVFKIIDVIVGLSLGHSPEVYSAFPSAYPHLWPVYIILSVLVCPFIRVGCHHVYEKMKAIASSC